MKCFNLFILKSNIKGLTTPLNLLSLQKKHVTLSNKFTSRWPLLLRTTHCAHCWF